MRREKILKKLHMLRRDETEYYSKSSVTEAIDVLIEAVEFLFDNQPKRLNPEDHIEDKRDMICDSLNSMET